MSKNRTTFILSPHKPISVRLPARYPENCAQDIIKGAHFDMARVIFDSILFIADDEFPKKEFYLEIDFESRSDKKCCEFDGRTLILYYENIPHDDSFKSTVAAITLYQLFYSQTKCLHIAVFKSVTFIMRHFNEFIKICTFVDGKGSIAKIFNEMVDKFPYMLGRKLPPKYLRTSNDNELYNLICVHLRICEENRIPLY